MSMLAALGARMDRMQAATTPAKAASYSSRFDRGANKGGADRKPWSSVPGLSDAEGQRRKDADVCFWCGEGGHPMRFCEAKKNGRPAKIN